MASRLRSIQGLYLIVVGIAFAVRGVIALGHPDFWDAVTTFDYAAVWTHSLSLLLVAPALIILVRRAQAGRAATVVAWIMAAGAALSAVANGIEDGLHLKDLGTLYVLGAAPYAYGMIVLAVLLGLGTRRAFAVVPALTFVGSLAYDSGGGLLIGATWAVFGLLVMTGRTEPAATIQEPATEDRSPPAEPEPA
jgi:hypothetical protein